MTTVHLSAMRLSYLSLRMVEFIVRLRRTGDPLIGRDFLHSANR